MTFSFETIDRWITTDTRENLLSRIGQNLCVGQGFSVATLNVDHLVKLEKDARFLAAYAQQDFVVADGNPVVWLRRLAGHQTRLVPGSELVQPVAEIAGQLGVPVALIGATTEALDEAAGQLASDHPEISFSLVHAPSFGFDPFGAEADALITQLRDSSSGLVFLALGAPKQEVFAARLRKTIPDIGVLSIGAGLDFLAGTQRRAPRFMRLLAMEWLWRMLLSPRRLTGRYVRCALVLPKYVRQALRLRFSRKNVESYAPAFLKKDGFATPEDNRASRSANARS